MALSKELNAYLSESSALKRIEILRAYQNEQISFDCSLVADLLELDLSQDEKALLLRLSNSSDSLALEAFFIDRMSHLQQELSVPAFQAWLEKTPHHLWYRIALLAQSPHTPQRLLYRMVESAYALGGSFLVRQIDKLSTLNEYSPAFHSLLLHRAVSTGYSSLNLEKLASDSINKFDPYNEKPLERSFPGAICYLARFAKQKLEKLKLPENNPPAWDALIANAISLSKQTDLLCQSATTRVKQLTNWDSLAEQWAHTLPVWMRTEVDADTLKHLFHTMDSNVSDRELSRHFAGVEVKHVKGFLEQNPSEKLSALCLRVVYLLQGIPGLNTLSSVTKSQAASAQSSSILQMLNGPVQTWFVAHIDSACLTELSTHLKKEEAEVLEVLEQSNSKKTPSFLAIQIPCDSTSRKQFFDVAYRNLTKSGSHNDDSFFETLLHCWENPKAERLDDLSAIARQAPAVWKLSYIQALGRFKDSDKAVLKLLDFIRSNEDAEVRGIIKALRGISNSRAAMELISCLTRPNVNVGMQLEIVNYLRDFDLNGLQSELRSALADLPQTPDTANPYWEVRETLSTLITIAPVAQVVELNTQANNEDLDTWLSQMIPRFKDLSSEVKRALRTARFFHTKVLSAGHSSTIDLSPAIDMQYKALELCFREMFEEACSMVIETGSLQRKLDVIGYARPIEQQMSQFESYINNLPVVSSIPFFSKFKLRKMLRAICQYRPGKRFTLDGLKAFGLFFLCFGRQDDRFGLANTISLPFASDTELFKFCKLLHTFQDMRNRAAHEGFQPDASNNLDAIWTSTGDVLATAFLINEHLKTVRSNPNAAKRKPEALDTFKTPQKKTQVQVIHKRSAS